MRKEKRNWSSQTEEKNWIAIFFVSFSFEMRDLSWMMWLTMLRHALNVDENDCRLDMYEFVLVGDQADESYCGNYFIYV